MRSASAWRSAPPRGRLSPESSAPAYCSPWSASARASACRWSPSDSCAPCCGACARRTRPPSPPPRRFCCWWPPSLALPPPCAYCAWPPLGDLRIQLLRQRRYLALAHLQTAQSLGDRAYLARRHALHIHLQHRQNQGLLAALVTLEQLGLKLPVAVLRNRQLQLAHPRLQRPRLVPVAPATPIPGALVAASAKKTRHLRFQNLLHCALYQPAKKILPAQPVLPSLHNLNTLSLASHLRRPPCA